jgi:hypothetical protein
MSPKEDIPVPDDIPLEEQFDSTPARDMDSKTSDFETNATVDGFFVWGN